MRKSSRPTPYREDHARARQSRVARRVAAVAGAAGAAIAGEAEAVGITYVPTTGVVAAQGIPGFSFTAPLTVTSGTLRPPTSVGVNGWDIDGNGQADFNLENYRSSAQFSGYLVPLLPFSTNPNGLLAGANTGKQNLLNLASAANIGPLAANWNNGKQWMTFAGLANQQSLFTTNQPGYFGFRFAFGNNANDYYYGWASVTIDILGGGYGFKISEAFYQSTPNTGINAGAVPVAVPEPSSMALLATGAAGVTAWRARRKKQPAAE